MKWPAWPCPDQKAARAFGQIKRESPLPLIADIHFNHRLALASLEQGADAIRINPGNLGGEAKTEAGAGGLPGPGRAPAPGGERRLPGGGPPGEVRGAHRRGDGGQRPALGQQFEDWGFFDFKISLKSSDVLVTVAAYGELSRQTDYPLHLGVTEAGGLIAGTVKSALGIGLLLAEGIGDTMRVSLTRDPVEEIRAAYEILRALHLRERGVELISCPTCGRCRIDLFSLAEEVERRLLAVTAPIKVAIMGCVVNGPGEAREADVGIAGGAGEGLLFKKGEVVRKVPEADLLRALLTEVAALTGEAVELPE